MLNFRDPLVGAFARRPRCRAIIMGYNLEEERSGSSASTVGSGRSCRSLYGVVGHDPNQRRSTTTTLTSPTACLTAFWLLEGADRLPHARRQSRFSSARDRYLGDRPAVQRAVEEVDGYPHIRIEFLPGSASDHLKAANSSADDGAAWLTIRTARTSCSCSTADRPEQQRLLRIQGLRRSTRRC